MNLIIIIAFPVTPPGKEGELLAQFTNTRKLQCILAGKRIDLCQGRKGWESVLAPTGEGSTEYDIESIRKEFHHLMTSVNSQNHKNIRRTYLK